MSNPKSLHTQQLTELFNLCEIPRVERGMFLALSESHARDHATYILSLVHDYIPEELRQEIAKQYTTQ